MIDGENKADEATLAGFSRIDDGVTFVELLVAVVLLGLASIGVLTAISAAIRATTAHDQVATAQAQLADAGDVLADVTFTGGSDPHYVDCGTPASYNAKLDPATGDWPAQAASWPDVAVTGVEFWNESTDMWEVTCQNDAMQRITLQANIDGHTRELAVVKRQGTEAIGVSGSAWDDDMVMPSPHPNL